MSHKILRSSSVLLASMIATAAMAQTPSQPTDPPRSGSTMPQTSPQTTERSSSHPTAATRQPLTAQSFANQAAVIGKAEIELGQLALKNSKDADVQKLAQRMITDHTNADKQLKSIAGMQSITLPKQLDAEHQALKDKLSKLKGEEFDREYSKAMAEGHDKAVTLFEAATRDAQLPTDLKQFASATLPTLKEHREMAHSVKDGESISSHGDHTRS
jgi:putative membrane protein